MNKTPSLEPGAVSPLTRIASVSQLRLQLEQTADERHWCLRWIRAFGPENQHYTGKQVHALEKLGLSPSEVARIVDAEFEPGARLQPIPQQPLGRDRETQRRTLLAELRRLESERDLFFAAAKVVTPQTQLPLTLESLRRMAAEAVPFEKALAELHGELGD